MRNLKHFILLFIPLAGCVSEYIPGLTENDEMIVVEGMITDQPGKNTINIYKTLSIWTKEFRTDVENCRVWITDDLGNEHHLMEEKIGTYVTDSATFKGIPGRKYTLHFTAKSNGELHSYESLPVEMIPVPPIDTVYFEKRDYMYLNLPAEGCQIYLETHDPADACKFYRWDYKETWEYRLPFNVENRICWATEKSSGILIKNTSLLSKNMIARYPVKLITNPIDRLKVKYCILINQYSLNEDEYYFWERLQNSVRMVGGLYDIIPSTIPGNIFSREDKLEKVLGYFSVSAVTSRRIFIKENFTGRNSLYELCLPDSTMLTNLPDTINGLNAKLWILYDYSDSVPPSVILTNKRYCGDCTSKGTNIKPSFWDDDH